MAVRGQNKHYTGSKYDETRQDWSLAVSNRDLPKSTLCMNSWWLGTAEVSYKKAHILVEVEMSSHLFFCKLKWAFLWLTSAVPNHQEFMQRVDLGKTLLDGIHVSLWNQLGIDASKTYRVRKIGEELPLSNLANMIAFLLFRDWDQYNPSIYLLIN